jgi:hypothetical protein
MPAMLMETITVFHLDMDYLFFHQKRCVSTRHEADQYGMLQDRHCKHNVTQWRVRVMSIPPRLP